MEVAMDQTQRPWHQIVSVCPDCSKRFRSNTTGLHPVSCPDAEQKESEYRGWRRDAEEWDRWDEEIVEDFGRWLGRLGKALAILLTGVFIAAASRWF
jgi:hypothetical protein